MSYNPENDIPASPGELKALYDVWQPWLYDTGTPADTNAYAPFGYEVPEGRTIFDPESVPIAAHAATFRRHFSNSDTQEIHFMVPRAATVLGINERFSITYRAAHFPAQDTQSPPEAYVPAVCMFGIHSPAVSGIDLRVYRLVAPRVIGGLVDGGRHDRLTEGRTFITEDNGMPPRITTTEREALAEVGQVCVMFFASEREVALHPEG